MWLERSKSGPFARFFGERTDPIYFWIFNYWRCARSLCAEKFTDRARFKISRFDWFLHRVSVSSRCTIRTNAAAVEKEIDLNVPRLQSDIFRPHRTHATLFRREITTQIRALFNNKIFARWVIFQVAVTFATLTVMLFLIFVLHVLITLLFSKKSVLFKFSWACARFVYVQGV